MKARCDLCHRDVEKTYMTRDAYIVGAVAPAYGEAAWICGRHVARFEDSGRRVYPSNIYRGWSADEWERTNKLPREGEEA